MQAADIQHSAASVKADQSGQARLRRTKIVFIYMYTDFIIPLETNECGDGEANWLTRATDRCSADCRSCCYSAINWKQNEQRNQHSQQQIKQAMQQRQVQFPFSLPFLPAWLMVVKLSSRVEFSSAILSLISFQSVRLVSSVQF